MKIVIVSGWFNPLHGGHLDHIEAAATLGDKLVVIVNNDKQQIIKKGQIILDEQNRARLVRALGVVDDVVMSVDTEYPVNNSLRLVRKLYPNDELIFAKGGDRNPDSHVLPEVETKACEDCDIRIVYGVGSHEVEKRDSSTRINQALGYKS